MGDEADLIQQAKQRDETALRALLLRHGPRVREQIAQGIGDHWQSVLDADDVMQVTYLEAFLQLEQLRAGDEKAFAVWLRRIADHNLRDAIKALTQQKRPQPERRVDRVAASDSAAVLLEQLGTGSSTASRYATREEGLSLLRDALAALPRDYRSVVELYDLQERPAGEVAKQMARSTGAVFMLRARAHQWLRRLLGSPSRFFSRRW